MARAHSHPHSSQEGPANKVACKRRSQTHTAVGWERKKKLAIAPHLWCTLSKLDGQTARANSAKEKRQERRQEKSEGLFSLFFSLGETRRSPLFSHDFSHDFCTGTFSALENAKKKNDKNDKNDYSRSFRIDVLTHHVCHLISGL